MVEEVAAWFKGHRGIDSATLDAFKVEWDGRNVQFPYPNGSKSRPDPTSPLKPEQHRFYFTKGLTPDLFHGPVPSGDVAFLCEGETDTMRLWQEFHGTMPVYGIGGVNTWHTGLLEQLKPYAKVYVCLDNDNYAGSSGADGAVDVVWRQVRSDLGTRAKRVYLPGTIKDLCEFFEQADLDTFHLLTQKMGASHYKPLDFKTPPPPTRWLMENWIARGDLTLIVGKGGLGKSWITMALALGVARGDDTFLGVPLREQGAVLYVDEENPVDVVYHRLKRMGLQPDRDGHRLRYLWNQNIKLDRDATTLLDEVAEFKPVAVFLDSLTRLHSKNENAVGDIGPLFNEALLPLARETGAAVCLIHHHNKNADARGSTDIINSADAVIEVYDQGSANPGKFLMRCTKSRRVMTGAVLLGGVVDQPDGSVKIVFDPPRNYPF